MAGQYLGAGKCSGCSGGAAGRSGLFRRCHILSNRIAVTGEELDPLAHSVTFFAEDREELRLDVFWDDRPWLIEARKNQADDSRRDARVDEPADLHCAIDQIGIVFAVSVVEATWDEEALLLVVAQRSGWCVGQCCEFSDAHGDPLCNFGHLRLDLNTNVNHA